MIQWLLPLGFAALAALIVPLVIHWWPRPQADTVMFAALRWLPLRSRERRRSRLHQRVLLALRLALLTVLALGLAEPVIHPQGVAARWLLVDPALPAASITAAPGVQVHWLAPGFPVLTADAGPPADDVPVPLASLLRQLDAELPPAVQLQVRVPAPLYGLDAQRIRLGRAVEWQTVGTAATPASAPLKVLAHVAPSASRPQQVLDALMAAWQLQGHAVQLDTADAAAPAADVALVLWLDAAPLPATLEQWLRRGGRVLWMPAPQADGDARLIDEQGQPLLHQRAFGAGQIHASAAALDPEALPALAEADMPQQLWTLLAAADASRLPADSRSLAPIQDAALRAGPLRSLVDGWRWLALLLFVAERWYAWRPRRAA